MGQMFEGIWAICWKNETEIPNIQRDDINLLSLFIFPLFHAVCHLRVDRLLAGKIVHKYAVFYKQMASQ